MRQILRLGHRLGQTQRLLQTDFGRDGLVDEFFEARSADGLEHLLGLFFIGSGLTPGKVERIRHDSQNTDRIRKKSVSFHAKTRRAQM